MAVASPAYLLTIEEDTADPSGPQRITLSSDLAYLRSGIGTTCDRAAPVFPADRRKFRAPSDSTFDIEFFAVENPVRAVRAALRTHHDNVCFSVGVCSVILFLPVGATGAYAPIQEATKLLGYERWSIKDGLVENISRKPAPQAFELVELTIATEFGHDHIVTSAAIELAGNFRRLQRLTAAFAPEALSDLRIPINDAQRCLDQIQKLSVALSMDIPPGARAAASPTQTLQASPEKLKYDELLTHLVELNSTVVYVTTQGFHGAPPILNHISLISHHSLLGAGTAWRAITRVARSIFAVLNDPPIPKTLAAAVNFKNTDDLRSPYSDIRRLVHFSGRLGFTETDLAITCPTQALFLHSLPHWSLSTITHEALHAYVRRILATVFHKRGLDGKVAANTNEVVSHARAFLARAAKGAPSNLKHKSAITELRDYIFHFVIWYREALDRYQLISGTHPKTLTLVLSTDLTPEELVEGFHNTFRTLEEIFVHVLDAHYFYPQEPETFCGSLWVSWAAVPSVVARLDWYILRTLVAVGSLVGDDDVYSALDEAIGVLGKTVERLRVVPECKNAATLVQNRLGSNELMQWLDLVFPAAYQFALAIRRICALPLSQISEDEASDDAPSEPEAEPDQKSAQPPVRPNPDSFECAGIDDPLDFVFHHLREGLGSLSARPVDFADAARRSAWMYILLASHPK